MLTNQEMEEISKELNHSKKPPSYRPSSFPSDDLGRRPEGCREGCPEGCIDALRIVQKSRGWISDDALVDIASFLGISPDEVESVASFYNLIYRRPVGKHVFHLCDSVSCWVMGATHLQEHLCRKYKIGLGQTTPEGTLTLLPIACLGLCEQAPAILIDHEPYGNLDIPQVDKLTDRILTL